MRSCGEFENVNAALWLLVSPVVSVVSFCVCVRACGEHHHVMDRLHVWLPGRLIGWRDGGFMLSNQ